MCHLTPFSNVEPIIKKSGNTLNYITIVRFPLIVLVVALHSKIWINDLVDVNTLSLTRFLSELITQLTMLAVPTFFVISGYLFFRNMPTKGAFPLSIFVRKLQSRVYTLFIPYMLWNMFIVIVKGVQYQISSGNGLQFLTWDSFVAGQPIDFPLWYVRNLMLLCIFSPGIYWLLRYGFLRKLVMLVVLFNSITLFFPIILGVGINSFLYFMLGSAVALSGYELSSVIRRFGRVSLWGAIVFLFIKMMLFIFSIEDGVLCVQILSFITPIIREIIDKIYVLCGIGAVLYLSITYVEYKKQRSEHKKFVLSRKMQRISNSTFFILAFHTPVPYTISELFLSRLLPFHFDLIHALQLLLAPVINIFICFVAYKLVLFFPKSVRKAITGHS